MIELLEQATRRPVSRETIEKLEAYVGLLRAESKRQNLIATSTLEQVWSRHIADSAQLLRYEPHRACSWIDIGSGAGLPGIVVSCIAEGSVTLVEPRRLRADFLHRCVDALNLRASVRSEKAERVQGKFDVVTARAVAALPRLLEISAHLSTRNTVWALPKGRNAEQELAEALKAWQGSFRVEPSVTDDESFIVVGTEVRARK